MSASFVYEIITDKNKPSLGAGTSSDVAPLQETFGNICTTDDIRTLRAMHAATGQQKSLWGEIAAKLEQLQGEDYARKVSLRISVEY